MSVDRDKFFDSVRDSLFGGSLTQEQVDGIDYLLDVWERHFEAPNPRDGDKWLAYALATVFHETAQKMVPLEEYGQGEGKDYGEPTEPYGHAYYGRGHVQLTWAENYQKAEKNLKERYGVHAPVHQYPEKALEDEISALILYDGMVHGWFTGAGLPQFFNSTEENPYDARTIVNGHDKADLIAGYYTKFKAALA